MAKIIRHPDYNWDLMLYDIAILKLWTIIPPDKITPVCLPNMDESTRFEGKTATAAGWGLHENKIIPWDWRFTGMPADEEHIKSEPREIIMKVARSASCRNATESPSILCVSMDNRAKSGCKVFIKNNQLSLSVKLS